MREEIPTPKNFPIRPGTIDYGKDYEFKMAALLSLRCASNNKLNNAWVAMNVDQCGAFDDIVLHVATNAKKQITYLIQLKHQMKLSDITAREFKTKDGGFRLTKYHDTIREIKNAITKENDELIEPHEVIEHFRRIRDNIVFILFTNRGTTESDFLKSVSKKSEADLKWLLYENIDTNNGNLFLFDYDKLEVEDDIRCFVEEKFFLFAKQLHIDKLDDVIENEIKKLLIPLKIDKSSLTALVQKFMLFITDWAKGELGGHYPLTKNEVLKMILFLLITPHQMKLSLSEVVGTYEVDLWNKIIEDKIITLVDADENVAHFLSVCIQTDVKKYCESSTNKNLWKRHPSEISRDILRIAAKAKEIRPSDAYECMWKSGEVPLILVLEDKNLKEVDKIVNILESIEAPFRVVIVRKTTELLVTKKIKPFTTLEDLNKEQKKKILNVCVKLQGRLSIKLSDFVNDEVVHLITVNDIINILSEKFSVGNEFTPLPNNFIERSLERVYLEPTVLQEICTDIFVVKCNSLGDFKLFVRKHKLDISDYQVCADVVGKIDSRILLIEEHENLQQFERFKRKHQSIHYLSLDQSDKLEWFKSTGTIKHITKFRKTLEVNAYQSPRSFIENTTASHLISSYPGMGKSIFMDYIAKHITTESWVLRINFIDYVEFYKSEDFECLDASQYLLHLSNTILSKETRSKDLTKAIFGQYLWDKKVVIIFDGFDEVPVRLQDKVKIMIKCIKESEVGMFITTRPGLKHQLEKLVDSFAIDLSPFSNNDQITFLIAYFRNAIGGLNNFANYQTLIVEFAHKLLNAAKRNLNDHDQEFTGIPLQTKLLAEVFTEDCKQFVDSRVFPKSYFDLYHLYKRFMEEKVKVACAKFGGSTDDLIYRYKTIRSLYALRLLFEEDVKQLNIDEMLQHEIKFFPNTLQLIQKDGIVVSESVSNVTFVHRTFAEYLSAEWLTENIDSEHQEIVEILIKKTFDPNFTIIRNIFDRILARNCPLHLAIINRRVDVFKELVIDTNVLNTTDKGNRTFLHLIAAWGVCHRKNIVFEDEGVNFYQTVAADKMTEMLKLIPNKHITTAKDDLLNCTPIDYGVLAGSLNVADAICARLQNLNQCITIQNVDLKYMSLYLSKCSYAALGSTLVKHFINSQLKSCIKQRQLVTDDKNSLHDATVRGNFQKVSLCISMGSNVDGTDTFGYTPLHLAVMFGHPLLIQILLTSKTDVNIKDNTGKTSLHWASAIGKLNIVAQLLSAQADVNLTDNDSMSALHYAVITNTNDQIQTVTLLLEHNSDITIMDHYQKTPLHYALHYNELEVLKLLLRYATNIGTVNPDIATPEGTKAISDADNLKLMLSTQDADGGTILHWAADKDCAEIVRLLLSYGADPEIKNQDGLTALHWAAEKGSLKTLRVLLDCVRDINSQDNTGRTALHWAALNGHVDCVTELLTRGIDVETKDNFNTGALQWAAFNGHTRIAELLILKGADVNAKNSNGLNVLQWAILNNHIDFINTLLKEGVDLETVDGNKNTALHSSAALGRTAIVVSLLQNKINIEARDDEMRTALLRAAFKGHIDIIHKLIENGASLEAKDSQDRTALHVAVVNGHTEIVNLLLSKGVDMEAKDSHFMTPLILAAQHGRTDVLNSLLNKGTILEARDEKEMTPLLWAAQNGHRSSVDLLVSKGANVKVKNIHNSTVLHVASFDNYADILSLLLCKETDLEAADSAGRTALHLAAFKSNPATIGLLLTKGANIKAKDNGGMGVLHLVAFTGDVETAYLLISNKADIQDKDNDGRTACHWAAYNGNTAIVGLFLLMGIQIDSKDNDGMSSLHWAAHNGHADTVGLLLFKSALTDVTNKFNLTPLHMAAFGGHSAIIGLLLDQGAELEAKDNEGKTALHWAAHNGQTEAARLLISKGIRINTMDNKSMSALLWAVHDGHTDIVNLLLREEADVNIKDAEGNGVLHLAATNGHDQTLMFLLSQHPEVNIENNCKMTPLHLSAFNGYTTIVNLLLTKESDIDKRDITGRTALHYTVFKHSTETMCLLLTKGADKEIKDNEGWTVLHWASYNGHSDMVNTLLLQGANIEAKSNAFLGPLHMAAHNGHTNVANVLLSKGCLLHEPDDQGRTPLQLAVNDGHTKTVNLLKSKGAT